VPTPELDALERKFEDLLRLCKTLAQENRALRVQQHAWAAERTKLLERNETARNKLEAAIARLKALEQES
jgi:cell division protein ZapB